MRWCEIAQDSGLSERQCRRVHAAHMRSAPLFDRDAAIREVKEAIAFHEQAVSDLALVSMTARLDSVRVGAIAE
jgi:hypothetical protein